MAQLYPKNLRASAKPSGVGATGFFFVASSGVMVGSPEFGFS
jgi:hypothetical protein